MARGKGVRSGLDWNARIAELEGDRDERVPWVAVAEPLRERIELRKRREHRQHARGVDAPRGTFERRLTLAPDANVAHRRRERLAVLHHFVHGGERVQILAHLPGDERDRLAFAAQSL